MSRSRTFDASMVEPPGQLGHTKNGTPVVSMRLVERDRIPDGNGGWKDVPNPFFFTAEAYGSLAENIAASQCWIKGGWVIATGTLRVDAYTDKQGVKREPLKLVLDTIGPDLRQGRVTGGFEKASRGRQGGAPQQSSPQQAQQPQQPQWGSQHPQQAQPAQWGAQQPQQAPQQQPSQPAQQWTTGETSDPWGSQPTWGSNG